MPVFCGTLLPQARPCASFCPTPFPRSLCSSPESARPKSDFTYRSICTLPPLGLLFLTALAAPAVYTYLDLPSRSSINLFLTTDTLYNPPYRLFTQSPRPRQPGPLPPLPTMAVGGANGGFPNGESKTFDRNIRYIPYSYTSADHHGSALRLVLAARPEWEGAESNVEFVRFTDGITNTLLKAVNKRRGLSKEEVDREAILLRAYGNGTDLIIDRHRETQNHELLMRHRLAPELLARFENGMMYRFVQGTVTQPEDLRKPAIYKAVARKLAQWHAVVPCIPGRTGHSRKNSRADDGNAPSFASLGDAEFQQAIDGIAPGKPSPNVWTVMQKWIFALPSDTDAQRAVQAELQKELGTLVSELSQRPGLGANGLVFAHCDLLSGNVIVLPKITTGGVTNGDKATESVTFIDYEYATPSPAAFDIANHFAEWGGFDCDFSVLPTRAQRREFITEYVHAYFSILEENPTDPVDEAAEVERLFSEVDLFRGVPGFYWGIWALIQATISEIDFDYASYAETRLGEYWAWRSEVSGEREKAGQEQPLRERRWAQEK
ncbi:kinase-like domain-containing protein [Podospora didyma]|uniref:ethanolamine kinase n=1 Tax=Podospora didyma TaxID=330526 RepID=A0AAE0U869_9PEZI|nr:kinase-like domain-containing protein [Podospora didyma]